MAGNLRDKPAIPRGVATREWIEPGLSLNFRAGAPPRRRAAGAPSGREFLPAPRPPSAVAATTVLEDTPRTPLGLMAPRPPCWPPHAPPSGLRGRHFRHFSLLASAVAASASSPLGLRRPLHRCCPGRSCARSPTHAAPADGPRARSRRRSSNNARATPPPGMPWCRCCPQAPTEGRGPPATSPATTAENATAGLIMKCR